MAIVLYARKSVEQKNSISCETQLEYCRAMLRPEERRESILTLEDNGCSGGNTDRDGFQRMMALVREGQVSKVVVYRLDRISRSLSDFVRMLQEFKAHRVEFVSSQEAFDTSSPYGEMMVKLLMVFAEFERSSAISRVTQAYAHRSELGFYMGGRRPYGFELVPAVLHNIQTKRLHPLPQEARQVQRIFSLYAQEDLSLRSLLVRLREEGITPLHGGAWTTSRLCALLKNPLYVRADPDVYRYYEAQGVRIVGEPARFTGACGAQLYGCSGAGPHPDGRLVLLTHPGLVDSAVWLQCQRRLERNHRMGSSVSNHTSWLAGLVVCARCGHVMTTIKGKPNRLGEVRRYFYCTGRSHGSCAGAQVTVYAQQLEELLDACIVQKLSALHVEAGPVHSPQLDALRLRQLSVEQAQQQLMDTLLAHGLNDDLLALANAQAARLHHEQQRIEQELCRLLRRERAAAPKPDLAALWHHAQKEQKKAAAALLVRRILVQEDGSLVIEWRL